VASPPSSGAGPLSTIWNEPHLRVGRRIVDEAVRAQEGEIGQQVVDGVGVGPRVEGRAQTPAVRRFRLGRFGVGGRALALEHHAPAGPARLDPADRGLVEVQDALVPQVVEGLVEALGLEALHGVDGVARGRSRVRARSDRRVLAEPQLVLRLTHPETHDPGAPFVEPVLGGGLRILEPRLAGQGRETRRQTVGREAVGGELERLDQRPGILAPLEAGQGAAAGRQ
jgi:hypothetical protein